MGDRSHGGDDKMHATARIDDPVWLGDEFKRMSCALLRRYHRGPGDTIEAAAGRVAVKHRIDPSILMQGWNRGPRETKTSRWMAVFKAYHAEFCEAHSAESYEEKRNAAAGHVHPTLLRLADLVAGRADRQAGERQEEIIPKP